MTHLRLEPITVDNVRIACALTVREDQQRFVAPVPVSLAEAYVQPGIAWPRLVYDGDDAVAFVMAAFDPAAEMDFFRAGVWRLNVTGDRQGRGYGRFAVEQVAAEAVRRGFDRITVLWESGEGGPEPFYLRLGFRPTGQIFHGEVVAELPLSGD